MCKWLKWIGMTLSKMATLKDLCFGLWNDMAQKYQKKNILGGIHFLRRQDFGLFWSPFPLGRLHRKWMPPYHLLKNWSKWCTNFECYNQLQPSKVKWIENLFLENLSYSLSVRNSHSSTIHLHLIWALSSRSVWSYRKKNDNSQVIQQAL